MLYEAKEEIGIRMDRTVLELEGEEEGNEKASVMVLLSQPSNGWSNGQNTHIVF